MHSWFPFQPGQTAFSGLGISLQVLDHQHIEPLIAAAADPAIWEYYTFNGGNAARMRRFLEESLAAQQAGQRLTLVVFVNGHQLPVGSSTFYELNTSWQNLEIGFTWLNPAFWGKGVNEAVKYLMLQYCFEQLQLLRVQFKAWDKNRRSCLALEKIGARYEGLIRNHMIRENGQVRSSRYYSILLEEWPDVRARLGYLIAGKALGK